MTIVGSDKEFNQVRKSDYQKRFPEICAIIKKYAGVQDVRVVTDSGRTKYVYEFCLDSGINGVRTIVNIMKLNPANYKVDWRAWSNIIEIEYTVKSKTKIAQILDEKLAEKAKGTAKNPCAEVIMPTGSYPNGNHDDTADALSYTINSIKEKKMKTQAIEITEQVKIGNVVFDVPNQDFEKAVEAMDNLTATLTEIVAEREEKAKAYGDSLPATLNEHYANIIGSYRIAIETIDKITEVPK